MSSTIFLVWTAETTKDHAVVIRGVANALEAAEQWGVGRLFGDDAAAVLVLGGLGQEDGQPTPILVTSRLEPVMHARLAGPA